MKFAGLGCGVMPSARKQFLYWPGGVLDGKLTVISNVMLWPGLRLTLAVQDVGVLVELQLFGQGFPLNAVLGFADVVILVMVGGGEAGLLPEKKPSPNTTGPLNALQSGATVIWNVQVPPAVQIASGLFSKDLVTKSWSSVHPQLVQGT